MPPLGRSALQVCSVVAVESEDDEELCCLLVARVLPKLREMFTGQQQGEEKGREGETTLMLDMCRVLESVSFQCRNSVLHRVYGGGHYLEPISHHGYCFTGVW